MALPTSTQMTNLYLYGQATAPNEAGKVSDSWIREKGYIHQYEVDINEYMNGPGRFASPARIELLRRFFLDWSGNNVASINLPTGTYSKTQMYSLLGISPSWDEIQQAFYDDGSGDYLERAYVWGTTAFKVNDGVQFIVEANGTRRIENFALVPYSNDNDRENFDFEGGAGNWVTELGNIWAEPKIDPSGIGRKVSITFVNPRNVTTFSQADYLIAKGSIPFSNPLLYISFVQQGFAFVDSLFQGGTSRFLDASQRPILYGTAGDDRFIEGRFLRSNNLIASHSYLGQFVGNGLTYILGEGNDNVALGVGNFFVLDGGGNDYIKVGGGATDLYGGAGKDTYEISGSGTKRIVDSNIDGDRVFLCIRME